LESLHQRFLEGKQIVKENDAFGSSVLAMKKYLDNPLEKEETAALSQVHVAWLPCNLVDQFLQTS